MNQVQTELIEKAAAESAKVGGANMPSTSADAAAAQSQASNSSVAPAPALLDQFSEEQLDLSPPQSAEELERSQNAFNALSKDTCSESEYIDLALSAESTFLNQYKNLLNM